MEHPHFGMSGLRHVRTFGSLIVHWLAWALPEVRPQAGA
jgi:hypothetical protein